MNIRDLLAQNNVVIQEGAYTCGPCTLLNVLRLKGDQSHDEDEVSKRCNAKPELGTSYEDLLRAAREIGIEIVEEKAGATLADIERNIDNGAYVIICYLHAFSGHGHYAVVIEYDDAAFYLVDPSLGMVRLRKEYIQKWWYGEHGAKQWLAAVK